MSLRCDDGPSGDRQDIRFVSGGLWCAGWHYADAAARSSTCIVMAHGFGATRHYGLDAFARRFQAEGYDVLLFDYRHFGESDGQPRGLLKVSVQLDDWHAAVAHARSLGYRRIVLWGTSFAGGHVLRIATEDTGIAAVISQVPHIDGMATAFAMPLATLPSVLFAICADLLLGLVGRRHYIRVFGQLGSFAAMATPGAHDALVAMLPGPEWRSYFDQNNRVTALSLLETMRYSPGKRAEQIKCPVLLQAGRKDRTTPFGPACKAAARIPDCEFLAHDVDHFDVYLGACFKAVVAEQINFLQRRAALHRAES